MKVWIFWFLTLIAVGCSTEGVEDLNSFELKYSNTIGIPFSNYNNRNRSFNVQVVNGLKKLVFLDAQKQTIIIVDFESNKLELSLSLDTEGSNGVGVLDPLSFVQLMESGDKFIIFNNWISKLYVITLKGEVLRSFDVNEFTEQFLSLPLPQSTSPIQLVDEFAFIPCYPHREREKISESPSIVKINLDNGDMTSFKRFPESYDEGYWDSAWRFAPSFYYDHEDGAMYISYPMEDNIIKIDQHGLSKRPVKSREIEVLQPLARDISIDQRKNFSKEQRDEYAMTSSNYFSIYFDEKNEIFLRLALIRPSLSSYRDGKKKPENSFVFFDKELNRLGESIIGSDYLMLYSFVHDGKLYTIDSNKQGQSEDSTYFSVFEIVKK